MYKFSKNQKIAIGIILGVLALILINYIYSRNTNHTQEEISTYQDENLAVEQAQEEAKKEIVVHIAGAVNTEGVIFLEEGARISDAIEKAGGTTEEADMLKVNLASQVEDGMKIYIPKKGEEITEEYETEESETQTSKAETDTKEQTTKSTKININKATQEQLEQLPGIGPSTAAKIIAYRKENGKFANVESIKEVSGIGDAKYNSIKDLITV